MIVDRKLANIVFDFNPLRADYPELYYRSESTVQKGDGESVLLRGGASYDFSTYFNSFSRRKWHKYADVDNVHLSIQLKGRLDIELLAIDRIDKEVVVTSLGTTAIDSQDFNCFEFEFPPHEAPILSFRIEAHGDTFLKDAFYYTRMDSSRVRDVNLALSTTTFKKEDFIARNVAMFKDEIRTDPEIAGNVSFIVVDNGRTLDPSTIEGDDVYLFNNANVGGSGGFARGMIEAQRLPKPATHVLVMDDDISLSSESIKRTFVLLSILNDEYRDAFVSGAMLSLQRPYFQIEDLGYANEIGKFGRVKHLMRMDRLKNIVHNERELPDLPNMYAAFWYCCIPVSTIAREGLPLPLFIRYDDAEYGMRCAPKFMTMNGIGVWHMEFKGRFNAYNERYCATRNALAIQAISGICRNIDFMEVTVKHIFLREMHKLNYGCAELMLDGIEDYLKGPEFLATQQCEKLLKEKSGKAEKLVSLEELGYHEPIDFPQGRDEEHVGKVMSAFDKMTVNGKRRIPSFMRRKDPAVVPYSPSRSYDNSTRLHDQVLQVNSSGVMGMLNQFDEQRFEALMTRFESLVQEYESSREDVARRYADARERLISEEFWKQYLEIQ